MQLFVDSTEFKKVVQNELDSYVKLSKFIEHRIHDDDGKVVDEMIEQYFRFMTEKRDSSHIELTDSVRLMWKLHLLHPKTYRKDCFKRFGRVICPRADDLKLQFNENNNDANSNNAGSAKQTYRQFTDIDLKKSLILHYKFIQKVLKIKQTDRDIDRWTADYKQFMASVGSLQNDDDVIEPSVPADLIWHCHQLFPNIYFKESLVLANGKFVRHIVDLDEYKAKQARKFAPKQGINYSYFAVIAIFVVLVSGLLISSMYTHSSQQQLVNKLNAVTSTGVTCSTNDALLCTYIDAVEAIFSTTDRFLDTFGQTSFIFYRGRAISSYSNLIFYYPSTNEKVASSSLVSEFNDAAVMNQLVTVYGSNLCETSSVSTKRTPSRTSTTSGCYGWIYVSDPSDISAVEVPPISPVFQESGYAVLMGKVTDFNDDDLYYAYSVDFDYKVTPCRTGGTSCDIINAQRLLGNALFYVSLLANDKGFGLSSDLWNKMDLTYNTYFEYSSSDYQFYVFVNRYSDGYRFVHGEQSKQGTITSLNSVLRPGADEEYGEFLNYTRTSGEKKRSYIMGPYPNPSSSRIYIGSGYSIGYTDSDSAASDSGTVAIIGGVVGGFVLLCVLAAVIICCRNKSASSSSARPADQEMAPAPRQNPPSGAAMGGQEGVDETGNNNNVQMADFPAPSAPVYPQPSAPAVVASPPSYQVATASRSAASRPKPVRAVFASSSRTTPARSNYSSGGYSSRRSGGYSGGGYSGGGGGCGGGGG